MPAFSLENVSRARFTAYQADFLHGWIAIKNECLSNALGFATRHSWPAGNDGYQNTIQRVYSAIVA